MAPTLDTWKHIDMEVNYRMNISKLYGEENEDLNLGKSFRGGLSVTHKRKTVYGGSITSERMKLKRINHLKINEGQKLEVRKEELEQPAPSLPPEEIRKEGMVIRF